MPDDIGKIVRAAAFAATRHAGRKRKGGGPYIDHLIEVADLAASVAEVRDADAIAAAYLHDAVEDGLARRSEIERLFGPTVAGYVDELTDPEGSGEEERRHRQVEHASHLSPAAKTIKLADKISNIRDVTRSRPDGWSDERLAEYIEWGRSVVEGLRGVSPPLEKLFDDAAAGK